MITSIDATATKTEQGNFFKIEAETNLTSEEAATLRWFRRPLPDDHREEKAISVIFGINF